MPPHTLTNFEMQKYYPNESKFNGVYSRNNLPKITDWAHVINLDEYKSIGIIGYNDITYFNSFGVRHIKKEIKKFKANKNLS